MSKARLFGIGRREMKMNKQITKDRLVIQRIIERTAEVFKVNPKDIVLGKRGGNDLMFARHTCAYLLNGKIDRESIAALLGRKSRAYYYDAIRKVRENCRRDHDFHMKVLKLTEAFGVRY